MPPYRILPLLLLPLPLQMYRALTVCMAQPVS
jgi:hypothetical protein